MLFLTSKSIRFFLDENVRENNAVSLRAFRDCFIHANSLYIHDKRSPSPWSIPSRSN